MISVPLKTALEKHKPAGTEVYLTGVNELAAGNSGSGPKARGC